MGSNLSLNTEYKITIHPEIWIQKSNNVKKTKKNNGNNTLEISNADKTKYITRLIKSSKFKSILKYATHITNISEYVEKHLKFKPSKITYNSANNELIIIGIWTVNNGSKVPMELHNTPESGIGSTVKDGLHKAGYAGEIILASVPGGKVYFGMPAREISFEKI